MSHSEESHAQHLASLIGAPVEVVSRGLYSVNVCPVCGGHKGRLVQRAFLKLCRNCRVSWFMPQVDRVADEPDRLC